MLPQLYKHFRYLSEKGAVWVYSDPHFNDDDQKYILAVAPPTAEEQISRINKKVGKHDTLFILGDVGEPELLKKVRGHKILILGNHDAGASIYEPYVDEVFEGPLQIGEKLLLSHEPIAQDYALNIHGHTHGHKETDIYHLCVCSDVIDYTPMKLNDIVKSGVLKQIKSLHRDTIDNATERSKRRK